MSPSRSQARTYHAARDRREMMTAVLGVLGVLVLTVVAIWLLAPHNDTTNVPSPTVATQPPNTSVTTAAGSVTTTTAPSPVTTAPGG
jgi:hypothetical protein